ncbi:methionine synthase II (cobalamin-independent) [Streptomyces glaucescens]
MRLPVLSDEEMNPRQQELAARIAGRRGAVRGTFRVWLHSPEMCERAESLGAFARFDHRARLERLYAEIPADRWVLPYDQGTGAELDLVRGLPEDRDVCLGVVDATVPGLEDVDTVMARIDAAAELKDIEDMAVSPSRGFADVAGRPLLTADDQRRKLVLVETIARYCWGNVF